eukprot:scaffold14.g1019.t1
MSNTLLRYVAFTSDFGEALKPFISRRAYLASYAVVAAYGIADTLDKGRAAYARSAAAAAQQQHPAQPGTLPPAALCTCWTQSPQGLAQACAAGAASLAPPSMMARSTHEAPTALVPVTAAVADTALWHAAASLAIPGVLINRTVWAGGRLLASHPRLLPWRHAARAAPSLVGLSLIPLLVPHIDEAVTEWMEAHVRPQLGTSAHIAGDSGSAAASPR